MGIDAGGRAREAWSDGRGDGWIAGEFVAPAAGLLDESGNGHADLLSVPWLRTCSGYEADH